MSTSDEVVLKLANIIQILADEYQASNPRMLVSNKHMKCLQEGLESAVERMKAKIDGGPNVAG